jgi:hypothetical protein
LDEEFIKGIPVAEGGLDPEYNNPDPSQRCRGDHGGNPVCTSLKAVERVADNYATKYDLKLTAGENWTKERVLKSIVDGVPVMVNYGGPPRNRVAHSIVIYGYDLTVEPDKGGAIYALDPMTGGTIPPTTWDGFQKLWAESDYGDPLNTTSGGDYAAYKFWALTIQ